uniref:Uncharacterized protein n=1 Tax=Oryza brachyantha TaxID=4533 RepID=J3N8P8_ORYBR
MTSTAIAVKDSAKEAWDAIKTMRISMDRVCARQKLREFAGSTRKSAGHDAGDGEATTGMERPPGTSRQRQGCDGVNRVMRDLG